MWRRLASIILFSTIATLVIACEALSHANDYSSSGLDNCAPGTLSCGGQCLPESVQNCGACGQECSADQVCSGGSCGSQCTDNLTQCGSNCVDTQNDPLNCGQCGGSPDAGSCPICQDGVCAAECTTPATLCNGKCVDFTSDTKNCGGCTVTGKSFACTGTQVCSGGTCAASCGAGLTACKNSGVTECVDESTDVDNCGGCGTKCKAPQTHGVRVCEQVLTQPQPTCAIACENGFTSCGGQCVCGTCNDQSGSNGGSGMQCPLGISCVDGTCGGVIKPG